MQFLPCLQRLHCAALMAVSGGAVAQTMSLWGGDLARFLPPLPMMTLAAAFGAGVAGLLVSDAFGRRGVWGLLSSGFGWCIATALGAGIGAAVFAVQPRLGISGGLLRALEEGASLGLLAVGDGIVTSPPVAVIWILSGIAMHFGARVELVALGARAI